MRALHGFILEVKLLHLGEDGLLFLQVPEKEIPGKDIFFGRVFQVFLEADGRRTAAKANFLPEEVLAGGLSADRRVDLKGWHGGLVAKGVGQRLNLHFPILP